MTLLVACVATLLLTQALFAVWLMVYTWDEPARMAATRGPSTFCRPRCSFTVLLPARHEEEVIADTICRVAAAHYPRSLIEIRVICHGDDIETIAAAESAVQGGDVSNVRVRSFTGGPVNKPRGLNIGLADTGNTVVCVFDAEDDIHPDIFHVVNTIMVEEEVGVVQAGVQLMNFRDHWFSIHNCLEYFFWYKSRLHFHAKVGMIPLAGNTVFIRRDLIERVGGWDENCLTEDADIGMRLSVLGEPVRVVYDSEWVTREETPNTVAALVRQRTRWHQGFLQVLVKRDWARVPGMHRRLLALLTLGQPVLDAVLIASLPVVVAASFLLDLPVTVAILSYAPLYAVAAQIVVSTVGARLFAAEFDQRLPLTTLLRIPFTYLPYQWLLGLGAIRALARHILGHTNWEKTAHLGAHRTALVLTAPPSTPRMPAEAGAAQAEAVQPSAPPPRAYPAPARPGAPGFADLEQATGA